MIYLLDANTYIEAKNSYYSMDFCPANRDHFLAKADPWLIAKAMSSGAIVVTHESLVSDATKKVKAPNICKQFGVQCINTFEFLRQTKAKFGLI